MSPDQLNSAIPANSPLMRELAEKVLAITGSRNPKLVERPLPEDDPKQRKPTIELAEKLLGWRPTINLDEGLKSTIAYFEGLLREHGKSIVGDRTLLPSSAIDK